MQVEKQSNDADVEVRSEPDFTRRRRRSRPYYGVGP